MDKSREYCVILITCGNKEEAEKLARLLIENRLAACVQITDVTSFYEWDGEINRDNEQLLFIKSKSASYDEIEEIISQNHSYDVPEIIQLPISRGIEAYLRWIDTVSK